MFIQDINKLQSDPRWMALNKALIQEVGAAAKARAFEHQLDDLIKSPEQMHLTKNSSSNGAQQRSSIDQWEPSEAANLLLGILARNKSSAPTLRLIITKFNEGIEPLQQEIKSQIDNSGLSYHAQIAKAVSSSEPNTIGQQITQPAGQNPHDAAAMLMMTGQLKTTLQTPIGPAVMIWHRLEDSNASTHTSKHSINSVSIAIEHNELGTIVAHIFSKPFEIDVAIACQEKSVSIIESQTNLLYTQLLDAAPTIKVHTEAQRHA